MTDLFEFSRFARNEKGAVAIITGLAIIPLVLAAGVAADYALVQVAKARLDSAADAAVLSAIKAAQDTVATRSENTPNPRQEAIAAGLIQAEKSFYAQAGKGANDLLAKPTFDVKFIGQEVSAKATYSASIPSNFGRLAGVNTLYYGGVAAAQLLMPKFLDFYLLVDVSASMGLPSTVAGQNQLADASPDGRQRGGAGCQFACHYPWAASYNFARANNIPLRVDAVGGAIAQLMKTAQESQTMRKQFKVGVYPFITHVNSFVDLTDNLMDGQNSVATAINYNPETEMTDFGKLLDSGDDKLYARDLNPNYKANPHIPADTVTIGAGGSHIHRIFDEINAKITDVGDGSGASKGQPFVFFVSDGMEDSQWFEPSTGAWPGVSSWPTEAGVTVSIRAMDPSKCDVLKARGVTVSVLQIPYPAFANPTDFGAYEAFKVNDAVPKLDAAMKSCASQGFYYKADTPEQIAAAMQAMFQQAVQSARLTQ